MKKDKFRVPEKFRVENPPGKGYPDAKYTNNGFFSFTLDNKKKIQVVCIAADGGGWDHVSVSILEKGKSKIPSWDVMNLVKDIFWEEEARVIQFHPPHSEYVDQIPYVLHLWKFQRGTIPNPPSIMVGQNPGKKPRDLSNIFPLNNS